jgi:hypothetical protein
MKKTKIYSDYVWAKLGNWLMLASSINTLLSDIVSLDLANWNCKYENKGFKDEKSFKGTLRRTYNYLKKYSSLKRTYALGQIQIALKYSYLIKNAYYARNILQKRGVI